MVGEGNKAYYSSMQMILIVSLSIHLEKQLDIATLWEKWAPLLGLIGSFDLKTY